MPATILWGLLAQHNTVDFIVQCGGCLTVGARVRHRYCNSAHWGDSYVHRATAAACQKQRLAVQTMAASAIWLKAARQRPSWHNRMGTPVDAARRLQPGLVSAAKRPREQAPAKPAPRQAQQARATSFCGDE